MHTLLKRQRNICFLLRRLNCKPRRVIVTVSLQRKGHKGQHVDTVSVLQDIQIAIPQAEADHCSDTRLLSGSSPHPEHVVIAPLDIQRMIIHQTVNDPVRLRSPVKNISNNM